MFVKFFIERPIFATVCALLIILGGAVSIPQLPIAEFPNLAPPQVNVQSGYNGASAETVESAVTNPLEQQINGVPGMKYISSSSDSGGGSGISHLRYRARRGPGRCGRAKPRHHRARTAAG